MANILPEKMKKAVKKQYILRIFALLLFASSIAGLFGSVLLVPTFTQSRGELANVLKEHVNASKLINKKEYKSLQDIVHATNKQLEKLNKLEDKDVGALIDELTNIRESFADVIAIQTIHYIKHEGGADRLRVSGIAEDRSALSEFTTGLGESKIFEKVDLPLANLADSEETPFAIIISI